MFLSCHCIAFGLSYVCIVLYPTFLRPDVKLKLALSLHVLNLALVNLQTVFECTCFTFEEKRTRKGVHKNLILLVQLRSVV